MQCRETFPPENHWSSAEYDYQSRYMDYDGYMEDDTYLDDDDVGIGPETSPPRRYIISLNSYYLSMVHLYVIIFYL